MKYMCMECRRVHRLLYTAQNCCALRVESILDEQTAPCEAGGEDCLGKDCVFCQGTGLMLKPPEIATPQGEDVATKAMQPSGVDPEKPLGI